MSSVITDSYLSRFASDVINGLNSKPKKLPAKYFYDSKGSKLFQMIMKLPEYYLTNCEFEILQTYKEEFLNNFINPNGFDLIEFGAGDGLKTKILLKHFLQSNVEFSYMPIDISTAAIDDLGIALNNELPGLKYEGIVADYFDALTNLKRSKRKKVILFLGSNIGNFPSQESTKFLLQINKNLNKGDMLLIGMDLKKDPEIILNAYNDSAGITREFNMNLLARMNNELGANFDLAHFKHYPNYDPEDMCAKSFLISLKDQIVTFDKIKYKVEFSYAEEIYVEISQKYDKTLIESIYKGAGFSELKSFTDCKHYFYNGIWQK